MAELHVFGQLVGGDGFPFTSLCCKWRLESGSCFRLVQGNASGQTHCDSPNEDEMAIWAHPIDVHYAVKGVDGWPRLHLEVVAIDSYGRTEIAGYGCCMIPTVAGTHELTTHMWRPYGTMREQISTFFLGRAPELQHKDIVSSSTDRFRLHTEPTGQVRLRISVLPKDFTRYGIIF